jgi:putative redox protein
MSAAPMDVTLRRLSGALFEAKNPTGQTLLIDGPPNVGGVSGGLRPMEACLASLASCSAVDVLLILNQQKEPLADFELSVHGERADAVPAVFTSIHLHFAAGGDVSPGKLARAARLSMEKYCSVAKMLGAGGVHITHGVSRILRLEGAPEGLRVRVTDDATTSARAAGRGPETPLEGARWLIAERAGEVVGVALLEEGAAPRALVEGQSSELDAVFSQAAKQEHERGTRGDGGPSTAPAA